MRVGRYVLPRNSLVTGEGRIQGERLGIGIIQVEHDGIIIPVELAVYDNDGQEGIFIPGSMEANAAKEVAANLGQNLGTSVAIHIPEDAGGKSTPQIRLYPDALPER